MAEGPNPNKQSWWHTLPGLLTAIAGIVTAITGLVLGLHQAGFFSQEKEGKDGLKPPQTSTSAAGPSTSPPPTLAASGSASSPPRVSIPSPPTTPPKQAMGMLITSSGSVEFDRISYNAMGDGKIGVLQFGAKVEIPLSKIKRITFGEDWAIGLEYWNGGTEQTKLSCFANFPVAFHAGDKEITYTCEDIKVIKQIEFHKPE